MRAREEENTKPLNGCLQADAEAEICLLRGFKSADGTAAHRWEENAQKGRFHGCGRVIRS